MGMMERKAKTRNIPDSDLVIWRMLKSKDEEGRTAADS